MFIMFCKGILGSSEAISLRNPVALVFHKHPYVYGIRTTSHWKLPIFGRRMWKADDIADSGCGDKTRVQILKRNKIQKTRIR